MSWVPVDDTLPYHRKLLGCSPSARWLLVASWCWCSHQGTDGVIPRAALPVIDPSLRGAALPRAAAELVANHWWEETADGWQCHDWLDWHESAVIIAARKSSERARVRTWRASRTASHDASRTDNVLGTYDRTNEVRTPDVPGHSSSSSSSSSSDVKKDPPPVLRTGSPPAGAGSRRRRHPTASDNGSGAWTSPAALVALYNTEAPDECPSVQTLDATRRRKARAYLAEFPEQAWWSAVFVQIGASRFLRGLKPGPGHEHFVADFDWLLTKGKDGSSNAVKVKDGRYHD